MVVTLFLASVLFSLLFFLSDFVKGAQSRFDFGIFSLQPSDPVKLVVILLLANIFRADM